MRHTKKTRATLSKMRSGDKNPFWGKKHSPETRAKLAANLKKYRENRTFEVNDVSIKIPAKEWLHYLAGLIDADGSIRFKKGRPFVAVYNTCWSVIKWLETEVGGYIGGEDRRGRKISYQWVVAATRDVHLLCKELLPILKIKDVDAQIVITFLEEKYGTKL